MRKCIGSMIGLIVLGIFACDTLGELTSEFQPRAPQVSCNRDRALSQRT